MTILRALLGLLFFCGVAWLMSSDRRRVNLRVVFGGIAMQVALALLILKWDMGRDLLDGFSKVVTRFLSYGESGARMVFGPLVGFHLDPTVAEGAPPSELTWFSSFPFHLNESQLRDVDIVFAFKALPTIIYFSAVMAILYYLGIMQWVISLMARTMTWLMRVSGAESLAMAANVFVGQT
jgi:CNT family concentrative nucleoside transporter